MDGKLVQKVEKFFSQYKNQIYRKDEILVRADEDPLGVYYLKSGVVKSYIISKKGDEIILNIYKPHSFFPMAWTMNNTRNTYYYQAITEAVVYRAPKERVLQFIKKEHDVLYDLLSRVYLGTDGLLLRLMHLRSGNAYARLITEIIIYAKRFGENIKDSPAYLLKIKEKDMARQSGMTRETVSREMKVLKEKKLLTFNKNMLVIHDITLLEQELKRSF